jgi:type VI protein secretion system component Hcp
MKKALSVCLLVLGFATWVGVRQASAQTSTFMHVPGISGSSTDSSHPGWIEVVSLSQTLEHVGKSPAAGRQWSCDVAVLKGLDVSGPPLWMAAVLGQVFGEIKIEVIRSGASPSKLYEIRLRFARVTGISTSGTGTYTESVTLRGDDAVLTFFPQSETGGTLPGVSAGIACG